MSHAKVLYLEAASPAENGIGILYVGSHNFSEAAWGLKGGSPKNVEAGVVLATKSTAVQQEWVSRLPFGLPNRNETSPDDYIPASANQEIRQALLMGDPCADEMLRTLLSSTSKID
jgi:hypothetical protein